MATKSGPGKAYRKGITLMDAIKRFDTKEKPKRGLSNSVGRME